MSNFEKAKIQWKNFLCSKIKDYGKLRNFDYGPEENSSVSKLSPFISHRILLEYQLIKDIKSKYKGNNVNKFIEEVYWRIYWKGFLENKPCIWDDFVRNKSYTYDLEIYKKAIEGNTSISYFNSWVFELKKYNYLHNHTRMWFASTWIFTLGLPWELGAKFFFYHLYDGDAASNLLSWRWVGGLQTKGKRYMFTPENLRKFSNNRFSAKEIINKDIILKDNFDFITSDTIYNSNAMKSSDHLVMFENDLNEASLKNIVNQYKKVFLILLADDDRHIAISNEVKQFKTKLMKEFAGKFSNLKFIKYNELQKNLIGISNIDLIYPSIGDNYDFIKKFKITHNIHIKNLVRNEDLLSWKFARKGFFKFKENIPEMNNFFEKKNQVWK